MSTALSQRRRAGRVPRDEARRRILAAAAETLEGQGYAGLTIDAVMGRARLARTVFYRHFDGRGDLVAALLEEVAAELGPLIEPAEDLEAVDDAGGMRELLDIGFALADRHGGLFRAAEQARHDDPGVARAWEAFREFSVARSMDLVRAREHVPGAVVLPVTEDVVRALIELNMRVMLAAGDGTAARAALFTIWSRTLGVDPGP